MVFTQTRNGGDRCQQNQKLPNEPTDSQASSKPIACLSVPPAKIGFQVPAKALTVRQFFSRKGLLSEWHPNYEFRAGQLEMAEAVESALTDKRHLIVEAGTGTGKTLAYLVPAILSGKRVVVSTGTKNLQEQLFFKDIPFLERHLGSAARLLYERARELRVPAEDLRRRKRAGAGGSRRSRRLSDHSRMGKVDRDRRPRRNQIAARIERRVGQDRRAWRSLLRPEVPAVRTLLHHQNASEGGRKRHHHRQSPSVFLPIWQ